MIAYKKIASISGLNMMSQLLSVLTFIFITSSFYGLDHIGEFAIVNSFVAIFSILSTGYMEQVLLVERRENIIRLIIVLLFLFIAVTVILLVVILSIFSVDYIFFILLNILIQALTKAMNTWLIAKGKLFAMAKIKFASSLFSPIVIFGFVRFFDASSKILLSSYAVAASFSLFLLLRLLPFKLFRLNILIKGYSLKRLKLVLNPYFDFFRFSMIAELFRTVAFRGPTIVLGYFFTKELAGVYGITQQLLVLPISVLMGAVSQVFIHDISELIHKRARLLSYFDKYLYPLFIFSISIVVVVLLLADNVVSLVWGDKMVRLPIMLKVFLPYLFSLIFSSVFQNVFTVLQSQFDLFKQKFLVLVASFLSCCLAVVSNDFVQAIFCFSVSLCIINIYYCWKARQLIIDNVN